MLIQRDQILLFWLNISDQMLEKIDFWKYRNQYGMSLKSQGPKWYCNVDFYLISSPIELYVLLVKQRTWSELKF